MTKLVSVRASKGFVKKVEDEGTSGRVRVVDDRRRNEVSSVFVQFCFISFSCHEQC